MPFDLETADKIADEIFLAMAALQKATLISGECALTERSLANAIRVIIYNHWQNILKMDKEIERLTLAP
jgi:hypothetical protein